MNSPKITVFGGRGYIGSEFCRMFSGDVVVEPKFDYEPSTPIILNLISTTHNYHVKTAPHLDIDTNLTLLVTLLENARKKFDSDFEFIQASSWFVYGNQETFPVKEDAHCNPKGFYSITKKASEDLLISYCETYGIRYKILRFPNVIGKNDKSAGKKKNALQYMIDTLCKNEEVSLYESDTYRDYLNVSDVARAIKLVIDKGESNQIYNVASGVSHKVWDLVHFAQSVADRGTIRPIPVPDFHKQVQTNSMFISISKLYHLGFRPRISVHDTITNMIKERLGNETY